MISALATSFSTETGDQQMSNRSLTFTLTAGTTAETEISVKSGPQLVITSAGSTLRIRPATGEITAADVLAARAVLNAARAYHDCCHRLHARNSTFNNWPKRG